MSRFQAGVNVSQQILDTQGQEQSVTLQNCSAVTIYVGDDQPTLDGSVVAGVPQTGFVLLANTPPVNIASFTGKLFARAAVAGGQIECVGKGRSSGSRPCCAGT